MKTGRVLLACIALGAGLAVLASAFTGYSWYSSRRWDTNALQATFDHLERGLGNRIEFCYELQNNTPFDYYVDINAQPTLMAMLDQAHPLAFGYEVLVLQHPIRVAAGQRTIARISFGKAQAAERGITRTAGGEGTEREQLARFVGEQYPNLQGFVLYDLQRRYRINFPKAVAGDFTRDSTR